MRARSPKTSTTRRSTGRPPRLALLVLVLAAAAALVVLVFVGRWEGRRHARDELHAMRRTFDAVGRLDNKTIDAYRINVDSRFDCLIYKRGSNRLALELCFDAKGRLVETTDRRSGKPKIASLREDPGASTIRVDPAEVVRLLKRLGAPGS
jgi:hypothetical protein